MRFDPFEPNENPEYYYRFEEKGYSIADEYGEHSYTKYQLELIQFEIAKKTPKGAWIYFWPDGKFICNNWKKKYACPTIEEAMESYKARKKRQIQIHNAWINRAMEGLRLMEMGKWVE